MRSSANRYLDSKYLQHQVNLKNYSLVDGEVYVVTNSVDMTTGLLYHSFRSCSAEQPTKKYQRSISVTWRDAINSNRKPCTKCRPASIQTSDEKLYLVHSTSRNLQSQLYPKQFVEKPD
jgi:hypothetical protein